MTMLADIRTRVRKDLRDTEPTEQRWTDTQLDRHIERALHDLDRHAPRESTTTLATTSGSRDLSLAGVTGLIDVDAVEYPVGQYPPVYAQFSRWEDTLTLLVDRLPGGDDATLYYTGAHVLDGSGSTVPVQLEELLAIGAAGYAALELASYDIEKLNVNPDTAAEYSRQGRAWLTAFQQLLHHHARGNRVRPRRMYRPAS